MTSNTYPYEDDWSGDWIDGMHWEETHQEGTVPVESAILLAVVLMVVLLSWGALSLISDSSEQISIPGAANSGNGLEDDGQQAPAPSLTNAEAIIAPYDSYVVTQGVHGLSYGHMAIDIAAGKGEPVRSPISGVVSEKFVDAIGNPTLVIENDRYKVTMLHGIYGVEIGDEVGIGDSVGVESNIGNTRDMQGNSCRNRDCGYHTHLNVFDKKEGMNVNPLNLFSPQ